MSDALGSALEAVRELDREITRLRAENSLMKERLGLKGAGCACRFEDDGETQTKWCAVHARLRADLAAAQADAKSWKTVALSNQAASQSHQDRWAKAEAELASGSFYKEADIDRLMAERDAAQEREQRMREALEPFAQFADAHVDEDGWSAGRMGERICDWFGPSEFRDARAALSAMRGEP